jgi:hypothetical protein
MLDTTTANNRRPTITVAPLDTVISSPRAELRHGERRAHQRARKHATIGKVQIGDQLVTWYKMVEGGLVTIEVLQVVQNGAEITLSDARYYELVRALAEIV